MCSCTEAFGYLGRVNVIKNSLKWEGSTSSPAPQPSCAVQPLEPAVFWLLAAYSFTILLASCAWCVKRNLLLSQGDVLWIPSSCGPWGQAREGHRDKPVACGLWVTWPEHAVLRLVPGNAERGRSKELWGHSKELCKDIHY